MRIQTKGRSITVTVTARDAADLAALCSYAIDAGDPDWDAGSQRLAARFAAVAETLEAGSASDVISEETSTKARAAWTRQLKALE